LPPNELVDFQRERALVELPGLLDFAGYVVGVDLKISIKCSKSL